MRLLLFLVLVGLIFYVVTNHRRDLLESVPHFGESENHRGEGPAETAGRAVDRALNKAGAALERFGERLEQETEAAVSTPPHAGRAGELQK